MMDAREVAGGDLPVPGFKSRCMTTVLNQFKEGARKVADSRRDLQVALQGLGIYDMTAERVLILVALEKGGKTVGELQRDAYFGSNISYNVGELEKDGYITSQVMEKDRRSRILHITSKGRDLVAQLLPEAGTAGESRRVG